MMTVGELKALLERYEDRCHVAINGTVVGDLTIGCEWPITEVKNHNGSSHLENDQRAPLVHLSTTPDFPSLLPRLVVGPL